MPRAAFEKLVTAQTLDVAAPTTYGRELLFVRRTESSRDVHLRLDQLGLSLPPQLPPRIPARRRFSGDLLEAVAVKSTTCTACTGESRKSA